MDNSPNLDEIMKNYCARKAQTAFNFQGEKNTMKKSKIGIAIASGVLSLAILSGAFMISGVNHNAGLETQQTAKKPHSFMITANAAEITPKPDSKIIGAFQTSGGFGWCMELYEREHGINQGISPAVFMEYELSSLKISGDDIESVTIRTTAKGTYFGVDPMPELVEGKPADADTDLENTVVFFDKNGKAFAAENYKSWDEYEAAKAKEKEKYSDYSLSSSYYTAKELKERADGLNTGDFTADRFTYNNTDKKSEINLNQCLNLIIEAEHYDETVSRLLDEIWECENRLLGLRAEHEEESGTISYNSEEAYDRMSELQTELLKYMLKEAAIEVTVNYTDNTSETKTLKLSEYYIDEIKSAWVALSET